MRRGPALGCLRCPIGHRPVAQRTARPPAPRPLPTRRTVTDAPDPPPEARRPRRRGRHPAHPHARLARPRRRRGRRLRGPRRRGRPPVGRGRHRGRSCAPRYAQGHPPRPAATATRSSARPAATWCSPAPPLSEAAAPLRHAATRLVEIWNGMPFFSPLWATGPRVVFLHHVHADMWQHGAAARTWPASATRSSAASRPRIYRRQPDDHPVAVVEGGDARARLPATELRRGRPARASTPASRPGGTAQRHPARRRRRPPRAGQALRPAHPRRRRGPALGARTSSSSIVGTGPDRARARGRWSTRSTPGAASASPAGSATTSCVDLYRRRGSWPRASVREGWGMTLTEAAACGTPAVATRIAGHVDAVADGASGLLADDDAEPRPPARPRRHRRRRSASGSQPERSRTPARFTWDATRPPASWRPWPTRPLRPTAAPPRRPHRVEPRAPAAPARGGARSAILAAIIYVPLLLTQPGQVGADTKTLPLPRPRPAARAGPASMWDPNIGLGTVTHQNIGYLWPIGPVLLGSPSALGVPDWVAQRLWLGIDPVPRRPRRPRPHAHAMGQEGPHVTAATFVYALTPYVLTPGGPALGDPAALRRPAVADRPHRPGAAAAAAGAYPAAVRARRRHHRQRQRHRAAPGRPRPRSCGSSTRCASPARSGSATPLGAVGRIGVLTVGCSLWWIAGLWAQGGYGIEILRYTETAETVATASLSLEVLRGLGYWFFYGERPARALDRAVASPTRSGLPLLVAHLPPPGPRPARRRPCARCRDRAFFVALLVVGAVRSPSAPTRGTTRRRPARRFKAFLAVRRRPGDAQPAPGRAAGRAGAGGVPRRRWSPRSPPSAPALGPARSPPASMVLAVLALPPLWRGQMVDAQPRPARGHPRRTGSRPPPTSTRRDDGTRVLEVPGADFAVVPVGQHRRPGHARPHGPALRGPRADPLRLAAVGRPAQRPRPPPPGAARSTPGAVAPIARFMGVGDISRALRPHLRALQHAPAPAALGRCSRTAPGLGEPVGFGGTERNAPRPDAAAARRGRAADPADAARPARGRRSSRSSDAEDRPHRADRPAGRAGRRRRGPRRRWPSAGLVDRPRAASSTPAPSPTTRPASSEQLDDDAVLVLTDTNRRAGPALEHRAGEHRLHRAGRPGAARASTPPTSASRSSPTPTTTPPRSPTSRAACGPRPPPTATRSRSPPRTTRSTPSTATPARPGASAASASATGETAPPHLPGPVTTDQLRSSRPSAACATASSPRSSQLRRRRAHHRRPRRQLPPRGPRPSRRPDRHASATQTFSHHRHHGHRDRPGQPAPLRRHQPGRLRRGRRGRPRRHPPGRRRRRPPAHRPARRRRRRRRSTTRSPSSSPASGWPAPWPSGPTPSRRWPAPSPCPTPATSRCSARSACPTRARRQRHRPGPRPARRRATAGSPPPPSRRLPGGLANRAMTAIDGDPDTWYSPGFLDQQGEYLDYTVRRARSPSTDWTSPCSTTAATRCPARLRLEVDGEAGPARSSCPTSTTRPSRTPATPSTSTLDRGGHRQAHRASSVADDPRRVREVETLDWFTDGRVVMPLGIVELGIDGLEAPPLPEQVDDTCRDDLVDVDGEPRPGVAPGHHRRPARRPADRPGRLRRRAARPARRRPRVLRTAPGADTGFDIDRLVLRSAAGGDADDQHRSAGRRRRPRRRRPEIDGHRPGPHQRRRRASRRPTRTSGWSSARATTSAGTPPPTARTSARPRSSTATPTAGRSPPGTDIEVHLEWTPAAGRVGDDLRLARVRRSSRSPWSLWPRRRRPAPAPRPTPAGCPSTQRPSMPLALAMDRVLRYPGPTPSRVRAGRHHRRRGRRRLRGHRADRRRVLGVGGGRHPAACPGPGRSSRSAARSS